jgi:hypothetical protein
MDPDMIADLVGVVRPALQALAEGPKERAEVAFLRLELDVARWAVRHAVTPEALDRVQAAFRHDPELRRAAAESRPKRARSSAAAGHI